MKGEGEAHTWNLHWD